MTHGRKVVRSDLACKQTCALQLVTASALSGKIRLKLRYWEVQATFLQAETWCGRLEGINGLCSVGLQESLGHTALSSKKAWALKRCWPVL